MIDIGLNFTNSRFDSDRPQVLERAKHVGLQHVIVTGTNIAESEKAASLCQQFPDYLSSTVGVHPHDADQVQGDYLQKIKALSSCSHVKAIGECGLDFNRNFSKPSQQIKVFSEQIQLAAELNMPLFLHQRDAFEPWFDLLSPYFGRIPAFIAHCFTGNLSELTQCVEAGMYIGITGWICDVKRGSELREIVKHIPLNQLLIETDAPYLTPKNMKPRPKSSRNEPSYLPYIVKMLAEHTEFSEQEIITQTIKNTETAFNFAKINR